MKTKLIYILMFLTLNLLAQEHKIAPLKKAVPLLKSIEKNAIIISGGENTIYVFIDPFCKYSQAFVKK